jgi:N-acetylmuramic acid 6-phosphate etherase
LAQLSFDDVHSAADCSVTALAASASRCLMRGGERSASRARQHVPPPSAPKKNSQTALLAVAIDSSTPAEPNTCRRRLSTLCNSATAPIRANGSVGGETTMSTEHASPRYSAIEAWSPGEILEAMIEGQFAAVAAVRTARDALEQAALAIETRLKDGGRLAYAGAGTSGRLAIQDGAELLPTFGWPADRLLLLLAGGEDALLGAVEGAEDDAEAAASLVRRYRLDACDVVIGVAASGTTPFTVAALRAARRCGALTVGIANNRDTPLLAEADHPIWLDTGPEPIAGSTRMKAGTAQRVALTLLSSLVMMRLGRVYRGLMVEMRAVNVKLQRRSEAILMRLTGCDREEAGAALIRAEGDLKTAILLLEGCDRDEAAAILARAGGRLHVAKELTRGPRR